MSSPVANDYSWKSRLRSSGVAPVALELPTRRRRSKRPLLPPLPILSPCSKVFAHVASVHKIMGLVGGKEWLLTAGVSKAWRETYVAHLKEENKWSEVWEATTSYKAALTTVSRLEYAVTSCKLDLSSPYFLDAAGKWAGKEVLLWARAHGMPWNAELCRGAAYSGRLQHLIWLREETSCPWNVYSIKYAAASRGLVNILEYLWEQVAELEGSSAKAIVQAVVDTPDGCANPIAVLEFARQHTTFLLRGTGWPEIYNDAGKTSLEVVQWLHNIGLEPTKKAVGKAMRHGKLDIIEWLLQHNDPRFVEQFDVGFNFDRWIRDAVKDTAQNGHAHVLSWLYDNDRISKAIVEKDVFPSVLREGHVGIAKWMRDINIPQGKWSTSAMEEELAQWLKETGVKWPSAMWQLEAGIGGNIDLWRLPCVRWAVSAGCPWGEWPDNARNALHELVLSGDPHAKEWVKWTSERGCPCV